MFYHFWLKIFLFFLVCSIYLISWGWKGSGKCLGKDYLGDCVYYQNTQECRRILGEELSLAQHKSYSLEDVQNVIRLVRAEEASSSIWVKINWERLLRLYLQQFIAEHQLKNKSVDEVNELLTSRNWVVMVGITLALLVLFVWFCEYQTGRLPNDLDLKKESDVLTLYLAAAMIFFFTAWGVFSFYYGFKLTQMAKDLFAYSVFVAAGTGLWKQMIRYRESLRNHYP